MVGTLVLALAITFSLFTTINNEQLVAYWFQPRTLFLDLYNWVTHLHLLQLFFFSAPIQECPQDVLDLCHSFLSLSIEEKDSSLYVPEERTSSSTASSDETAEEETQTSRRAHLNRFLESCDVESRVGPYKKACEKTTSRTRRNHVGKARDAIVAMLNVMTPGDGALLWETLQSSAHVEEGKTAKRSSGLVCTSTKLKITTNQFVK